MEPLIHSFKYLSLLCIVICTLIPQTYDYSLLTKCQHPVLAHKTQFLPWAKCVSSLNLEKPAVVSFLKLLFTFECSVLCTLCTMLHFLCFGTVCHLYFLLVMRFWCFLLSVCFFLLFQTSAADRNWWTDEQPSSSYAYIYTVRHVAVVVLNNMLFISLKMLLIK